MTPAGSADPLKPPLLVYDRVEANLRKTRLLLLAFALILLPVAAVIIPYIAELFLVVIGIFGTSVLARVDTSEGQILDANLLLLIALSMVLAVATVAAIAYLHFRWASSLVLRITGARPIDNEGDARLRRTVENLAIGAGLPPPRLYVVESPAPNLFSTGLRPEDTALVVTRGLLELLDPLETEGVIAHELVQIGNHDTRLGTVLAAGVAMLRLPWAIVLGFFRFLFKLNRFLGIGVLLYLGVPMLVSVPGSVAMAVALLNEGETLAAYIFLALAVLYAHVFFLAPVLGLLLLRAVSRERIFLSDADAVLLTRNPGALARALAKVSAAGQQALEVNPALAHLYLVDPRLKAPWWEGAFATHPGIEARLSALARMASFPPSEIDEARAAGRRHSQSSKTAIAPALQNPISPAEEHHETAETRRHGGAFRITGEGAAVFSAPLLSSPTVTHLRSGDLIVVDAEAGEFLHVLTANDETGYILRSTPIERVEA